MEILSIPIAPDLTLFKALNNSNSITHRNENELSRLLKLSKLKLTSLYEAPSETKNVFNWSTSQS